jgi:uncharacterized membrane protein YkvA (DUF1232 family)
LYRKAGGIGTILVLLSPTPYIACTDINDPGIHLPAVIARNQRSVRGRFWPKLRRNMAHLPFAADFLAAYYCAFDPQTPVRVKAILLAALAYFVLPADLIPDLIVGLGFTDDLTVLLAAITVVQGHLTSTHRENATRYLDVLKNDAA